MAFNDEVLKDGRGRVIRIDASTDKFATIAYRWGTAAGLLDGTNMYSNRIVSVAPVRRGLGNNRVAGGSSCEVVLANADGALDALAGRAYISTQAKLRLRIYVCLFDPTASPLSFTSKLLGEFLLTDWVRQNNTTLTLSLGDDVMGAVAQQAALPTLYDWHAAGGSAATNPLYDAFSLAESVSEYSPVQLAFGEDWVTAMPHILPHGTVDAAYQGKVIVPICCTRDTGAVSSTEITSLRIQWMSWDSRRVEVIEIPRTVIDGFGTSTVNVWTIERSPTITKNGVSFKIIYLVVRADLGCNNMLSNYITGHKVALSGYHPSPPFEGNGGYSLNGLEAQRAIVSNNPEASQYAWWAAGVVAWYVKGCPLSARTQTTSPIQHPIDVLTDLVTYYSNNTGITLNSTEAARVKLATQTAACAGAVQPWQFGPKRGDDPFQQPPSLRQVISEICQSADIDVFIDWSGQFSFSCDFWDFRISSSGSTSWTPDGAYQTSGNGTTTQYIPAVIPETWLADGVERWVPGEGERWAPFGRLWMQGGKASPADGADAVPFQGPWDFDTGQPSGIAIGDRIVEQTLSQGWRPFRQQAQSPWYWRSLNIVARDMVRFRTHIGGLQLELGQYFALSWTRGTTLGGPYSGTIFQCEAITYAPGDDTIEITAVWRDDVTTEQQYILDDETLLPYPDITITNTCDPGGAGTVNFGATVDLTNLVAGAILVIRDTTQAADVFTRNGAWRITAVNTTTPGAHFVTVAANGEGNFPAAGSVASGQWSIQYGATIYSTLVASAAASYPLGGDQYGKTTSTGGLYSNSGTGNRLNSG